MDFPCPLLPSVLSGVVSTGPEVRCLGCKPALQPWARDSTSLHQACFRSILESRNEHAPYPLKPLSLQDPENVSTSLPGLSCPSSGNLVTTFESGQPIFPSLITESVSPIKDIHPPSALSPASPPWPSSSAQPLGASSVVPHAPAVWPEGMGKEG